jgi:Raf kinase inhibitor-like YbhB/YbcL family protein
LSGRARLADRGREHGGGVAVSIAAALVAAQLLLGLDASSAMALSLTSTAFNPGEKIPSRYTCEGEDVSPPLVIGGVPEGTKSLALILDDPDAPDPKAPKRVWAHWLLYNLPPNTELLAEDVSQTALPEGTVTGMSDRKQASYHGPCPPVGRHRYFHKLYALDTMLPARPLTKTELEAAMHGHVLAEASLMGTYQKGDP